MLEELEEMERLREQRAREYWESLTPEEQRAENERLAEWQRDYDARKPERERALREAEAQVQREVADAALITDPMVNEVVDAVAIKYDFAGWGAFRADWYVPGIGFGGHQEDVPPEEVQRFVRVNVARVKNVIADDARRFKLPITRVATAHRRKYVEGRGKRPGPMSRRDILTRTKDWKDQ